MGRTWLDFCEFNEQYQRPREKALRGRTPLVLIPLALTPCPYIFFQFFNLSRILPTAGGSRGEEARKQHAGSRGSMVFGGGVGKRQESGEGIPSCLTKVT